MIECKHCEATYPIQPGSNAEALCMRASLPNYDNKVYFCDLACYFRHTRPNVPNGKRWLSNTNVNYFHQLQHQSGHEDWKPVPWLEKAYCSMHGLKYTAAAASEDDKEERENRENFENRDQADAESEQQRQS
jgi:hypothetical protein